MKSLKATMQDIINKRHIGDDYQRLMHTAIHDQTVMNFIKAHHISKNEIIASASKFYEYYIEKEKVNSGKKTLIPGYLPKLMMDGRTVTVTYVPTTETVRKHHTNQLKSRVHSISMPKMIRNADFNNFDSNSTKNRTQALEMSMDFIANYTKSPKKYHQGLYIYGEFGIGKTFLLAAIANRLASMEYQITMVHFPSFAADIKNSIGKNNVANKLDRIKKSSILMLDDIGADATSAWIRDDVLAVILEYRMQNELPTFFSSNASMKQLEEEHLQIDKAGNSEPLKAKRIMQRIRFLSQECLLTGKNRRLGNKT